MQACVCVHVLHECRSPWKPERVLDAPGVELQMPNMSTRKVKVILSKKEQMLLDNEPSLQPPDLDFQLISVFFG